MGTETLLAFLAFMTLLAVVLFAWWSKVKTEQRRHQDTQKSTLAADAPNQTAPGERPVDT